MKKILIIDDEPYIRRLLRKVLGKNGYEVREAEDGVTGEGVFTNERFDLVITDIIMPGREGISTLKTLRRLDPRIAVIAISGGGHIEPDTYLDIAKKFGADYTFEKPLKLKTLLEAVERLIGSSDTPCTT